MLESQGGNGPKTMMAADLGVCGSAKVSGVGIGWEGCGTHQYHWFPVSKCENAFMGVERVVLNLEDLRKLEQGMLSMSPSLVAKQKGWFANSFARVWFKTEQLSCKSVGKSSVLQSYHKDR